MGITTMKMMSNTSTTSTSGVTLISLRTPAFPLALRSMGFPPFSPLRRPPKTTADPNDPPSGGAGGRETKELGAGGLDVVEDDAELLGAVVAAEVHELRHLAVGQLTVGGEEDDLLAA